MKKHYLITLLSCLFAVCAWADEPITTLTSTATVSVSMSIQATENGTPIQVDWGNGTLVPKTINTSSVTVSGIPVSTKEIKIYGDASKIKYFSISASTFKLTSADFSANTGLVTLSLTNNSTLTSLTLPTAVETLTLSNSGLVTVDLSACTALKTLTCSSNTKLTGLTLPTGLESLTIGSNTLLTSLDLSTFASLKTLACTSQSAMASLTLPTETTKLESLNLTTIGLVSLDLSAYTALTTLTCSTNSKLTSLMLPGITGALSKATIKGNSALLSIDFSNCSSLKTIDCSSTNTSYKLANIILPIEPGILESLDASYSKITTLDLSSYLNLKTLNIGRCTALSTLVLPSVKTNLQEFAAEYMNNSTITTLDLSGYANLKTLKVRGFLSLDNFVLPDNGSSLTRFECIDMLFNTLDVSKYENLAYLDCSYNNLTSITIPESPLSNLMLTCFNNKIRMEDLPEGQFSLSYSPQSVEYTINESYTTNDIIDLSAWYVRKKGAGYYYFETGVYPVFTWYLEGSSDALIVGEDYTVTNGCKFQFADIPEGDVYCVISSPAYPDFSGGEKIKTNVTTIVDFVVGMDKKEVNVDVNVYTNGGFVVIDATEACDYIITSISGKVVAQGNTIQKVEKPVDESGVYVVNVKTSNENKSFKIVVPSVK